MGPPLSFTVELLPGQEPGDFTKKENATRLAHSLGAHGLRIEPVAGRWVRLVLLDTDPLREGFGLPAVTVDSGAETVILGRTEDGITLGHALADDAHLAVQGQNGSGKTNLVQGLLAQLAAAPDVLIAGSDITGLLLGRPFDGTAHRAWQAVGSGDLEAHAVLLEDLVAEMDRRLTTIPPRCDRITPTATTPTVLVVLEEFPGLLRAAGALPKPRTGKSLAERITTAQLRLLSEGRKAAFRVLTLAQRFEATAVGGGYARDQFALRLSFRVPADSLAMLHGDDARPLGQAHAAADPGRRLPLGARAGLRTHPGPLSSAPTASTATASPATADARPTGMERGHEPARLADHRRSADRPARPDASRSSPPWSPGS